MAKENKITKKQILEGLVAYFEDEDNAVEIELENGTVITNADIVDYATTTIEQLENKNTKAKERAAAKRAEGDALKAAILGVLAEDYKSGDDIVAELIDEYPEITKSKVTARVNQIIKEGGAHKTTAKAGDKKVIVYALGDAPTEE